MDLIDITGFNSPEKQEELERLYGPTVTSWGDVENWDDCIIKEEKSIVSELEEEFKGQGKCPFLDREDSYFYFCQKRAEKLEGMGLGFTEKPTLDSAQYNSKVGNFALQLWCMCGAERHKECMNYKEDL